MKNSTKYIRHLLMIIISSLFLGAGCGLLINAGLGSDSMSTLMEGISIITTISFSIINLLLNLTILILALVTGKNNIGLGSIIYPLFVSLGISLSSMLVPVFHNLTCRIIVYIFGFAFMIIAIGLNSKCECGKNPYDALCFNLASILKVKYGFVRTSIDLLMLIVGIILGGTYGPGTILAAFLMGAIAGKVITLVENNKVYRKYMMV